MERSVAFVVVLSLLAGLTASVAAADVSASIVPQPLSPVQIEGCYATAGGRELRGGAVSLPYRGGLAITFRNRGPKNANAVVFRFDRYGRDGVYRGTVFHIIDGTFTPGTDIDYGDAKGGTPVGMWAMVGFDAATTAMRCSVQSVQFADGTLWQQSPLPKLRCFMIRGQYGICMPVTQSDSSQP